MTTPLRNPEAVRALITERVNAAATQRMELAASTGTWECYYEGDQYVRTGVTHFGHPGTGRSLRTNTDPDTKKLRVTWNEITRRVRKTAAATWVDRLDFTIDPPAADCGIEASVYANTHENLVAAWCKRSRFVQMARYANDRRCVSGVYGLMLTLRSQFRPVGLDGQTVAMPDMDLGVMPFHPLRLILDPGCQYQDLNLHETVIYQDVWTSTAIRRAFPKLRFHDEDLRTVGQLSPYEQEVARLTSGRVFGRFRDYSTTKGARVYQLYQKDGAGLWSTMYACVELGPDNWQVPNMDAPVSPFGCQRVLPMALLHGHPRSDSWCSISDVGMAKDAQDVLNLTMTQWMRVFQKHSGWNWVVDKRWLGRKVEDGDARDKFHNAAGGIILGEGSSDKTVGMPQLVQSPAPSREMLEMAGITGDRLRDNMFRTEHDSGHGIRSHVPDAAYQRAIQNSGQVLGIRVSEDRDAYANLLMVAHGTLIKAVQAQAPTVLSMLTEHGFDEDDMAVVLQSDPEYPSCGLTISESSIKYRSTDERRAQIMELANSTNPAIMGMELRKALADLDQDATDDDRHIRQALQKDIARFLNTPGQQWEPMPLGVYNDWCLMYLRRALFDRAAKRNPETRQRVAAAIQLQEQAALQEALATDPKLALQQQQMAMDQQAAAMQAQAQTEAAPAAAPPENVGQLLDQLAGASSAA